MIYSGDSISDFAQLICSKKKKWLEDIGNIDDAVTAGIFPSEYGYKVIHSANIQRAYGSPCKSPCFMRHIHAGGEVHETEFSLSEKMRQMYLNYTN